MAEYIEREAAYEKCGWYNTVNGKSVCAIRKDELAAIPAADVVPVVHGRWIDNVDKDGKLCNAWRKCSACGGLNFSKKPPYCPSCGAKMDGGKNDAAD